MAKKSKIVERIPLPDKVIYWGTVAGALTAAAGAYTYFGGPTPVMSTSPLVGAVEVLEETHSADTVDQLSRWIRSDKSERYDIQQRLEYDPGNASLHEELLNIEEKIEENTSKRKTLKEKK